MAAAILFLEKNDIIILETVTQRKRSPKKQGKFGLPYQEGLMKQYDTVIVGAGPAGIFTALELIRKNPACKIVMVEKGQPIEKRHCPKSKFGKCLNCKPYCHITTGFSGAGAFSDGKLSLSYEVGGDLPELIGEEFTQNMIDYTDKIYLEFGADTHVEGIGKSEEVKEIRQDLSQTQNNAGEMQNNMKEMRQGMDDIRQDMKEMQHNMNQMQQDITQMQEGMSEMRENICDLQINVRKVQMTVENETNRNIKIIAEAHLNLSQKLDKALEVEQEREMLMLRVNRLENKIETDKLMKALGKV